MATPEHCLLIPLDITDKLLEPADRAPFDMQSHGFNRLAFERAQLPNHIVKEMDPRLTASKTVVKGGLDRRQFIEKAFHIARDKVNV